MPRLSTTLAMLLCPVLLHGQDNAPFITTSVVGTSTVVALAAAYPGLRIPFAITAGVAAIPSIGESTSMKYQSHRMKIQDAYIQDNYEALRVEIASGQGEHLDAILSLLRIPKEKCTEAKAHLKGAFKEIFESPSSSRAGTGYHIRMKTAHFRQ